MCKRKAAKPPKQGTHPKSQALPQKPLKPDSTQEPKKKDKDEMCIEVSRIFFINVIKHACCLLSTHRHSSTHRLGGGS